MSRENSKIKRKTLPMKRVRSFRIHNRSPEVQVEPPWLYYFVFCSKTSRFVVSLVLLAILSSAAPLAQAEFATDAESETSQVVDTSEDSTVNTTPEPESLPETEEDGSELLTDAARSTDLDAVMEPETVIVDPLPATLPDITEPTTDETVPDADIEGDAETSTTTADDIPVAIEEGEEITLDEVLEEDTIVDEETEVEVVAAEPKTDTVLTVNQDAAFTFARSQCTELASGSYYCHQAPAPKLADALFSAPDEGGDLEIFLIKDGRQRQLTRNQTDDASPYYDENSETIVWHRLIADRYQIISYDLKTGVETQLTSGNVNNMEPTRLGSYTAWQRWVDNAWQIILHDGQTEMQITTGSDHHLAPNIQSNLLVWNRQQANGMKLVDVYDLKTKTIVTVVDPDGLTVSNPRMVLVYDSHQPNGDILTRGFDMLTGKFIRLDGRPTSLPEEIPSSESTGETRALIQPKPSLKDVEIKEQNSDPDNNQTDQAEEPKTDHLTLDLRVASTSTELATPTPDHELVVFPLGNLSDSEQAVYEETDKLQ